MRGDIVSSEMIGNTILTRENFRSDEDWSKVQNEACKHFGLESVPDSIDMGNRYEFEEIKIIPQNWDRGLLNLILGSHDQNLQREVNKWLPVQVFNLSITLPKIINENKRMRMHITQTVVTGRDMMPRTVMVFINEEDGLSPAKR